MMTEEGRRRILTIRRIRLIILYSYSELLRMMIIIIID